MKAITQDLFYDYQFLANLNYNPAKSVAAFVKSSVNVDDNGYDQCIWLYENGKCRQLTSGKKENNYVWEDDENILFMANREGKDDEFKTIVYRINIHGGEATKAFELPLKVNTIKVLPEQYLIQATVDIRFSDYHELDETARQKIKDELKENQDYQVMDEYPFYFNGAGYINSLRNNLFLVDKKTFVIKALSLPTLDVESFDITPDNKQIVISGIDYRSFKGKWSQLYLYNINTGKLREIFSQTDMQIGRVFFYQDQIMVAGTYGKDYGAMEANKFYRLFDGKMELWLDNEGGLYNSVSTDCHYGKLKSFLSEDQQPYFISVKDSHSELLKLNDHALAVLIDKEGSVDDFTLGNDHLLIIGMYDQKLQELYEVKDGIYTQVSSFNEAVLSDHYVAKPERLCVCKKPHDVYGWVLKPKDFDPNISYPAILDIHGGPKAAYGELYFHEMQYWASRGYFVFYCNPRGSDGRGNDYADLRQKFGTIDYEDIMDFTDLVLKTYPMIDQKRVAVTGGSYGGYMTNWIIGHTDRFVCAASQRSIANWITEVAASDYGIDFVIEQDFDDPYKCADQLWQMSPLKYAHLASTPTLFIHSYEDYRCLIQEAMQMYTVLKCRGVDSKIVAFKGENHELSRSGKPKHRSKRLLEITSWIDKYTNKEKEVN